MSSGRRLFKQTDLARALRAAKKAGLPVERVEIDKTGKIIVVTNETTPADHEERNEWDE